MNKNKTYKNLRKLLKFLFIAASSCIILVPIYFIVVNSLKTVEESRMLSFSLPEVFQWGNYLEVIKAGSLVRALATAC